MNDAGALTGSVPATRPGVRKSCLGLRSSADRADGTGASRGIAGGRSVRTSKRTKRHAQAFLVNPRVCEAPVVTRSQSARQRVVFASRRQLHKVLGLVSEEHRL